MKVIILANSDWYLYNFRLPLAMRFLSNGWDVLMVSPAGPYVQRIRDAGMRYTALPLNRRGLNPFREVATTLRLMGLYRKERPDLVLHFTVKCVLYGSLTAKYLRVSGIVNAIPGTGYVFNDEKWMRRILRHCVSLLYRVALPRTQVIFQNPDDLRRFTDRGLAGAKSSHLIAGSGVNIDRFRPPVQRDRQDTFKVVFASRFLWSKGLGEFVAAAEIVHKRRPEIEFVAAGTLDTANPDSVTQGVIQEWRRRGTVEFVGHVEEMHQFLLGASLVVLPSYYGEGVPRVLIEAAACGIPLVASDMPGCREIVKDRENGLLVRPRDAEMLAEAIVTILSDASMRHAMGQKSRELAATEFSEDTVLARTLEVCDVALGKGKL